VLFEAGSIINRQEETDMASPERRSLIGAAAAAAVEDFCAAQSHPIAERPLQRRALPRTAMPPAAVAPAPFAR
jgi:hypothetical protein